MNNKQHIQSYVVLKDASNGLQSKQEGNNCVKYKVITLPNLSYVTFGSLVTLQSSTSSENATNITCMQSSVPSKSSSNVANLQTSVQSLNSGITALPVALFKNSGTDICVQSNIPCKNSTKVISVQLDVPNESSSRVVSTPPDISNNNSANGISAQHDEPCKNSNIAQPVALFKNCGTDISVKSSIPYKDSIKVLGVQLDIPHGSSSSVVSTQPDDSHSNSANVISSQSSVPCKSSNITEVNSTECGKILCPNSGESSDPNVTTANVTSIEADSGELCNDTNYDESNHMTIEDTVYREDKGDDTGKNKNIVETVEPDSKMQSEATTKGKNAKKTYNCILCKEPFPDMPSIIRHLTVHIDETPHKCEVCARMFSGKHALKLHVSNVHAGDKPFECSYCHQFFSRKGNLKTHIRTHTGERPYICDICSNTFPALGALKNHMQLKHTQEAEPINCTVCPKSFLNKMKFKQHMRNHDPNIVMKHGKPVLKPSTCTICSKVLTTKLSLKQHMRTHTGEKPYTCEICHRSFAIRNVLVVHKRTHTGERPYQCDVCNMTFTRKSYMKDHKKKVHTDIDVAPEGRSTESNAWDTYLQQNIEIQEAVEIVQSYVTT